MATENSIPDKPAYLVLYTEAFIFNRDGVDVAHMKGKMMNFAEKLRYLREQNGYSQEGLAEKLNVSRQVITKWENGTGVPKLNNLLMLADCFDVSLDELTGRMMTDSAEAELEYRKTLDALRQESMHAIALLDKAITMKTKTYPNEET